MRPVRSFHARMASFTFAILLPLGGCTGSVVHGRVGGDKLPPLTAGFWTSDDQTPDRFYVGLTAMDVPDACTSTVGYTQAYLDADAEYTTDHDGAAFEAAMNEAEERYWPEDYWTVMLGVVASDPSGVAGNYAFDDGAWLNITHVTAHRDWTGYYQDLPAAELPVEAFTANTTGKLEVTSFEEGGGMTARGDAELVDEAGEDAGSVTWKLSGDWCEGGQ